MGVETINRQTMATYGCRPKSARVGGISHASCLVGGLAQWLGCRYLTSGLSLICAWSMVDVWPLRG